MRTFALAGLAPLLLALGCAPDSVEEPLSLMSAVTITAPGGVGESSVSLRAVNDLFDRAADVRLPIAALDFAARVDASGFAIDRLVFDIGDLDVPAAGMPPEGLHLRDVALTMLPVAGDPYGAGNMYVRTADRLEFAARLPFQIDWKLQVAQGQLYELGPAVMAPLGAVLRITVVDGAARLKVVATCTELCWELPGLVAFEHGAIIVDAPLVLDAQ